VVLFEPTYCTVAGSQLTVQHKEGKLLLEPVSVHCKPEALLPELKQDGVVWTETGWGDMD
jgi:hypothetical protein